MGKRILQTAEPEGQQSWARGLCVGRVTGKKRKTAITPAESSSSGSQKKSCPNPVQLSFGDLKDALKACREGCLPDVRKKYSTQPEDFWLALRDEQQRSALHLAIGNGQWEVAEFLVQHWPNLMYAWDGSVAKNLR